MGIKRSIWVIIGGLVVLCGCNFPALETTAPQPSLTPLPPTETPIPLVALVGSEPIFLEDFEEEIRRYETAQSQSGIDLATVPDYREHILEGMIEQKLLALGAREAGVVIDEVALEMEIQRLGEVSGDGNLLEDWLELNQYSEESFKRSVTEELLARQMIAMITDQIPELVDQVHARHILVASREEADWIVSQLEAGVAFEDLAQEHSLDSSTRPTGGDLGWFPEHYLLIPEVSEKAFSTSPGSVSEVFESQLGFHIVQTLAREDHPLTFDALVSMREKIVQEWITMQRENIVIQFTAIP